MSKIVYLVGPNGDYKACSSGLAKRKLRDLVGWVMSDSPPEKKAEEALPPRMINTRDPDSKGVPAPKKRGYAKKPVDEKERDVQAGKDGGSKPAE